MSDWEQLRQIDMESPGLDSSTAARLPTPSRAVPKFAAIKKQCAAEQNLRDCEIRYRRLFETSHDGILLLDAKTGKITDVNPSLIQLLNYSRVEFLKMTLWDLGMPDDIEASRSAFRELQEKKYIRYENLPLRRRTGPPLSVEVISNIYQVHDANVIQCNIRDITERKHTEDSEKRGLQGQKMEAIGQLAGGLAHDFNNLLGVILGYCEVMDEQPDLTLASRKMITEIANAGTSAKSLTQRLLAFSRRQVLQPVFLDLNNKIRRTETMLARLIGEAIELSSVLPTSLGVIKADPNQIEQVLMNLVINARDAMPGGGKICIETSDVELDETFSRESSIKPGSYVLLSVTDTGSGMDEETQSHMFEPFFSTKPIDQGTGLGLSTVFGIVSQSGGTITVDSELGRGTVFKLYFPRCNDKTAIALEITPKSRLHGAETILLVDDATSLRGLVKRFLEHSGYSVIDSGDPAKALSMAKEHKGPLPLLLTDLVMPGFGGAVLAERLALLRPETRVLYMSGYAEPTVTQLRAPGRDPAFLEKPFTRDSLLKKVREVLDS